MFKKIGLLLCSVIFILCSTGCSTGLFGGAGYKITAEELGLEAYVAVTEDDSIATVEVLGKGDLKINAINSGTTTITATNNYGETVNIATTVADGNKITVEFEKFTMPENYVIATDVGMSTEAFDNAKALQAAIDSLADGGTVYIPKGIYKTGFIQLKDNVTIRMEGVLADYTQEYSDELAEKVNNGEFAVLRAINGGYDMFANHEIKGMGRDGADNFAITGGVIDMNGKSRCFIWTCAENVLLENVIMKDCPNNHAIQISGSKNVTIRNVMFAGYFKGGNTTTAEVVQIEETNPQCIGTTTYTATQFDEYEFYSCENVVIENCYFGRSDEYGTPTFAIGHHGCRGKYSAKGVQIKNCVFDNPRVCAIRAYGWNDVEISGCKFTSDENYSEAEGHYMIGLKIAGNQDVQLTNGAYLVKGYERGGCRNVNIHDNEFFIGEDSQIGGILQTVDVSVKFKDDAKAEGNLRVADFYTDKPYTFNGYKLVNNRIENVSFCDNKVTIENTMNRNYINLVSVKGLKIENNDVTTAETDLMESVLDGERISGAMLANCKGTMEWQRNFLVSATSANTTVPIALITPSGEKFEAFCTSASAELTITCEEGGIIKRSVADDGTLNIEVVADEGYVFDGYYVNGTKLTGGRIEFAQDTQVVAVFTK